MKKNSVKDIAKLIAEEFNIDSDFNDFMSNCKLIDIGLERIKEVKNQFLFKDLDKLRTTINSSNKELEPIIEEHKKNRPTIEIFQEMWEMRDENSAGIDIQEVALYFEKKLNKNRIKTITKPSKGSKKILIRNEKIRSEYYKLRNEKGKSQKEALSKLATKYSLAMSTILTITKK